MNLLPTHYKMRVHNHPAYTGQRLLNTAQKSSSASRKPYVSCRNSFSEKCTSTILHTPLLAHTCRYVGGRPHSKHGTTSQANHSMSLNTEPTNTAQACRPGRVSPCQWIYYLSFPNQHAAESGAVKNCATTWISPAKLIRDPRSRLCSFILLGSARGTSPSIFSYCCRSIGRCCSAV